MNKKKTLRKVTIILVLFFFLLMSVLNAAGYELAFRYGFRDSDREAEIPVPEGYLCTPHSFETGQGHLLQGYLLTAPDADPGSYRMVQIFAHGIKAGASDYAGYIRTFLAPDAPLFFYDAYGSGKSSGSSSGGLPEGVRDICAAIDYVESLPEFRGLPLRLIGHSWGAYAAGSALEFHPEVSEAYLYSGFNTSADMLEQDTSRHLGTFLTSFFLPYVRIYERLKFGKYSTASIERGVRASSAKVLIVQGLQDKRVDPEKYGILYLEKVLEGEPDVQFIILPDAVHTFPPVLPE